MTAQPETPAGTATCPAPRNAQTYLFILGHMRGTSSLLAHLLGSHRDICGYLETHIRYHRPDDFSTLRDRLRAEVGDPGGARYLMDKLIHDYIAPDLIEQMNVRTIFLAREPEPALRSLRHMMRDEHGEDAWERAFAHYRDRLQWLAQCAQRITRPGPFIRSRSLIHHTPAVLRMIERYLGLASPLEESYRTFKRSGVWSYGDYSSMILTGRVVRDGRTSHGEDVPVPPEILGEAEHIHRHCAAVLESRCAHVSAAAGDSTANGNGSPDA